MMNENFMTMAGALPAVILQDHSGYGTVYKWKCAEGSGLMTVYQVYPGIHLIENDFEAASCSLGGMVHQKMLEINHCREGQEGCRLPGGSCLSLGEGDLSIHAMDNCAPEMSFPLKYYRGISVVLEPETIVQDPPEILAESGMDLLHFREKFCADRSCFIMRSRDEIEHIFSKLYSVPKCLQKPYFKLKMQELLLFLSMVDTEKEKPQEAHIFLQAETVRVIQKRLVSNLRERPTIDELSREYLINAATLKETFKGIYGQPIGTYMRAYRMKQAARLLSQTRLTIAEIADQVGYENQSKFAAAFRSAFQTAPAEYRKRHLT